MFFRDRTPCQFGVPERICQLVRRTQARYKETDRFMRLVPRIHAQTQGGHELFVLGLPDETSDRFTVKVRVRVRKSWLGLGG